MLLAEQRKARANEQEATWQQISDAYIDFLEVVQANPDLKLRSQLATPDLTDEQRERMLLFDMLISLFERARGSGHSVVMRLSAAIPIVSKGKQTSRLGR